MLTADRAIQATLDRYIPAGLQGFLAAHGIRIQALDPAQRYAQASATLSLLRVDVDAWPVPPAGLFVVAERTLYLRSRSPMTIVHELGHGFDCAIGGGVYYSSTAPALADAFANAAGYITPYSATGKDEYFAEAFRAMHEANEEHSPWPRATRARLQRTDPTVYALLQTLLDDPEQALISC